MRRLVAPLVALLVSTGAAADGLAPRTDVRQLPVDRPGVSLLATPGPAEGVARQLAGRIPSELDALEGLLGRPLGTSLQIRLGYGRDDFRALQPADARAPGWAAGVAYPGLGLVVVDAQAAGRSGAPGAVLRHEIAHVALGRIGEERIPRWFSEGFAQLHAGEWSLSRGAVLARAAAARALIPVEDLGVGWPASPTDVDLAYAQSASLVAHMAGVDDGEALRRLFGELTAGLPFQEAVRVAFGQTLAGVEVDWQRTLRSRWGWIGVVLDGQLLWGVAALLLVIGGLRVGVARRRRLAALAEAEEAEAREAALRELAEAAAAIPATPTATATPTPTCAPTTTPPSRPGR